MDAPTPANRLDRGLFDGRLKVSHDTYQASALASGSTIDMGGTLPTNARVIMVLLSFDALGGSVTLDVGDDEDPNRYISAEDVSSLGSKLSDLVDGQGYKVDMTTSSTPDNQVVIITGGGTVNNSIALTIFYIVD